MAFVYYNPNPQGLHVGDCVIRAISKATDSSWEQTYMNIMIYGFMMSDKERQAIQKCMRQIEQS